MPLRMRNDNVLIEYEPPPERSESGLVIMPDVAPEKPVQLYAARVLNVGPGFVAEYRPRPRGERPGEDKGPRLGKRFVPTTVKPGERVLVEGLAGDQVRGAHSFRRRIVREAELFAVVGEDVRING